jgi:hypothetical protein
MTIAHRVLTVMTAVYANDDGWSYYMLTTRDAACWLARRLNAVVD